MFQQPFLFLFGYQITLLDILQRYFPESLPGNLSLALQGTFSSPIKDIIHFQSITECSWFQAIDTLPPPSLFLSSSVKNKKLRIAAKRVLAVLLRSVCARLCVNYLRGWWSVTLRLWCRNSIISVLRWVLSAAMLNLEASIISSAIFELFELVDCFVVQMLEVTVLRSLLIRGMYELTSSPKKHFHYLFVLISFKTSFFSTDHKKIV